MPGAQNFKRYDKDNSGAISYAEAAEMLMKLNLHDVRPECLNHIFKMADSDGNGELDYTEFCTLLMAEDTLSLGKKRISSSRVEGGPWLPQGGRQLSDLAVTLRQNASLQRVNSASSLTHSTSHGSLAAIPVASTFVKGKPFDRNMWLERTRMRRQEEQLARQQPMVRAMPQHQKNDVSERAGLHLTRVWRCALTLTAAHLRHHQDPRHVIRGGPRRGQVL